MTIATIEAAIDSFIHGIATTANYGALEYVELGLRFSGAGVKLDWERAIANFDVSALAGATINSAKLVQDVTVATVEGAADRSGKVKRCTRPADWVESEVTWLNYKAGTTWTDEGGDMDASTPTPVDFTIPTATGTWEITGLAGFVTDALANRAGTVSVILHLVSEGDDDLDRQTRWRSSEYATASERWRLVVDYTPPAGGNRRRLLAAQAVWH